MKLLRALACIALLLCIAGWPGQAQGRPYRGAIPWSVLLCKFSDSVQPVHPDASYFQTFFLQSGADGLSDYLKSVSYGLVNLDGSSVHGWYTEPHTLAYEKSLRKINRFQPIDDCIAAAKS